MSEDKMHVLLIEDNPGDARLVEEMLKESGEDDFRAETRGSLQAGMRILSEGCGDQVILLDLELPDGSGLETLRRIAPFAEEASVVVITASQDERLGVEALKVGAIDYLIKGQIDGRQLRRIRTTLWSATTCRWSCTVSRCRMISRACTIAEVFCCLRNNR